MSVYIKLLNPDGDIQLAGQVANEQMLSEGYFLYDGDLPKGKKFRYVAGELVSIPEEIKPLSKAELVGDMIDILLPILETVYNDGSVFTDIKKVLPTEIKVALGEKITQLKEANKDVR